MEKKKPEERRKDTVLIEIAKGVQARLEKYEKDEEGEELTPHLHIQSGESRRKNSGSQKLRADPHD